MRIPVCDKCKRKNVKGVLCAHCDAGYCYECLASHPYLMCICPACGRYLCWECFEGMISCDLVASH